MTIFALCVFSGGLERTNSDAAAEALRAAGYQVFRLPTELKKTLEVEGDDYVEIRGKGADDQDSRDAIWEDARRIVDPFDGDVDCVGAASIEPFDYLTCPPLDRCAHCTGLGTPDRFIGSGRNLVANAE